jgi:GT2 family glycosyltransferase
MSQVPQVTIGVPVYRGELFVAATLRSIQAQTHREFLALISFDGPEPETEEVCRPFLKDSRFRLVVQPERRGWVGNINWLMSQVETPYWYYHQQDDLVAPRYVEALLGEAERAPAAAVVYCDISLFGSRRGTMAQASVTGPAPARQLLLLSEHHAAVAFRGLTRVEALRHAGGLRPNAVEDFSAETTWMAAAARWGELRRVPGALYRKRYHADNTHTKWALWPAAKRVRAWTVHCADMLEQAMLVEATREERHSLWLAAVRRLVSQRLAFGYINVAGLSPAERGAMLAGFFEEVRAARALDIPGWLGAGWEEIQRWTESFHQLPPEPPPVPSLRALARGVGQRLLSFKK